MLVAKHSSMLFSTVLTDCAFFSFCDKEDKEQQLSFVGCLAFVGFCWVLCWVHFFSLLNILNLVNYSVSLGMAKF